MESMNLTVVERKTRLIGAILVERGLLTPAQLREALEVQAREGGLLGEIVSARVRGFPGAGFSGHRGAVGRSRDRGRVRYLVPCSASTAEAGRTAGRRRDVPPGRRCAPRARARQPRSDRSALELQRETGERLGEILVGQGVISRLELAGALSEHWASLTKLRGPGTTSAPVVAADAARCRPESSRRSRLSWSGWARGSRSAMASRDREHAAQVERLSARVEELVAVVPADGLAGELVVQVERLSGKVDELVAAAPGDRLASELLGEVGRLSARVEELAAAVPLDELGSLGEGQRRAEEVLGRVVSEFAGLREEADAIARGADGELAARFDRLSARVEELVAAVPADRLAGQVEQLSGKVDELVAAAPADQLVGEVEGLSARIEELAAVVPADGLAGELVVQVERLSGKVDELVAAAPGDRLASELLGEVGRLSARVEELAAAVPLDELGSLGEGQRRAEEVLGRVVSEFAGLREEADAKLDAIARCRRRRRGARGSVRSVVGSGRGVAAAVPLDELGSLGEGQRRAEEVLGRVVSEFAGLREEADAKLDAIAHVVGADGELAARFDRLSARVEELAAAVPLDELGSLGEGQRRAEEVLGRVVSEFAGLREEADAIARAAGADGELRGSVRSVVGSGRGAGRGGAGGWAGGRAGGPARAVVGQGWRACGGRTCRSACGRGRRAVRPGRGVGGGGAGGWAGGRAGRSG